MSIYLKYPTTLYNQNTHFYPDWMDIVVIPITCNAQTWHFCGCMLVTRLRLRGNLPRYT